MSFLRAPGAAAAPPTADRQGRLILLSFMGIWLGYWLLQAVLPVHPIGHAGASALMVQWTFVWSVVATYLAGDHCTAPAPGPRPLRIDPRIIYAALAVSLLGTLLLIVDKVVIQGIDYSAGLANAREQWRELGEARDGRISSPFSALGYLLSPSYAVAITLIPLADLRGRRLIVATIGMAGLAAINTMLTGGRSTLVLALLLYLVARMLAGTHGARQPRLRLRSVALLALLFVISGGYFMAIFYFRAEASGISLPIYARGTIEYLGLVPEQSLTNAPDSSFLSAAIHMIVMTITYITHSFATTVSIYEFGPQNNDALVMFANIASIARKLGLMGDFDANWFAAGLFPSLPGALYLQGSWAGLLGGGIVLGAILAAAHALHRRRPSILSFCLLVAAIVTLLASPALFTADVMMFPFILPHFVAYYLLGRWLAARRRPAR